MTASPRNVARNAAQQCGHTRVRPLQRGEMRHARTPHARTIKWRAHGAYARDAFRRAETAKRAPTHHPNNTKQTLVGRLFGAAW
eukprot:1100224-Lingulodinium_polyedra.AAC.1